MKHVNNTTKAINIWILGIIINLFSCGYQNSVKNIVELGGGKKYISSTKKIASKCYEFKLNKCEYDIIKGLDKEVGPWDPDNPVLTTPYTGKELFNLIASYAVENKKKLIYKNKAEFEKYNNGYFFIKEFIGNSSYHYVFQYRLLHETPKQVIILQDELVDFLNRIPDTTFKQMISLQDELVGFSDRLLCETPKQVITLQDELVDFLNGLPDTTSKQAGDFSVKNYNNLKKFINTYKKDGEKLNGMLMQICRNKEKRIINSIKIQKKIYYVCMVLGVATLVSTVIDFSLSNRRVSFLLLFSFVMFFIASIIFMVRKAFLEQELNIVNKTPSMLSTKIKKY